METETTAGVPHPHRPASPVRYHATISPPPLTSVLRDLLYTLGMLLFFPVAGLDCLRKGRRYLTRLRHRYGLIPADARPACTRHLVLYCHNIGELRTAIPLVRTLRARHADWAISLFTKAFEPYKMAPDLLPEAVQRFFVPLESSYFVRALLRRLRPDALITLENDLRPQLVMQAKRLGIATLYLGGELSARERSRHPSAPRYRDLLRATDVIALRTEADRRELQALGVPAEHFTVCGNLRYDVSALSLAIADPRLDAFLRAWRASGPLLVAGSTYAEEEAVLLQCLTALRDEFPTLRLLMAPRRPDRAVEVARAAAASGLRTAVRSHLADPQTSLADVLVLDTMGELTSVYGAADVAYVGGSLIDNGGHNVVEAAVHGVPVLFGPHIETNREIAEALLARHAAAMVADGAELQTTVRALLRDPAQRQRMGAAAAAVVRDLSGATDICVHALEAVLRQRAAGNDRLSD